MVKSEWDQIEGLDTQSIRDYLTDIRARMYRQALLQTVTSALFCGLILLTILFLLNRVILLPMPVSTVSWLAMSVAVIVGVWVSVKHRKDLLSVACAVDEKMELGERLSTAFELMQANPQGEFAQLQIRDTAETVRTLDIAENKSVSYSKIPETVSDSAFADRTLFHGSDFLRGAETIDGCTAAGVG